MSQANGQQAPTAPVLDTIVIEPVDPAKQTQTATVQTPAAAAQPDWLAAAVPAYASDVDPRYRGKSLKDIIDMHKNAESTIGRQSQEVGIWRKLVQDMGTAQVLAKTDNSNTTAQEEALQISSEDILRDPVVSITKVVTKVVKDAIKPVTETQEATLRRTAYSELARDFPLMTQWGEDPAFKAFAASEAHVEDAEAVAKGDPKAARRLLSAYKDRLALIDSLKGGSTTTTTVTTDTTGKPQGLEGARQATTESGGGARQTAGGETFTSKQITDMIINNPTEYRSDAFQARLRDAAKNGRILA